MRAATLNQNHFMVSVPKIDTKKFKSLIKLMGWTVAPAKSTARLYDPETGDYVNDETMQAIEDARSGQDQGTSYSSFEEFEKAMRAL